MLAPGERCERRRGRGWSCAIRPDFRPALCNACTSTSSRPACRGAAGRLPTRVKVEDVTDYQKLLARLSDVELERLEKAAEVAKETLPEHP